MTVEVNPYEPPKASIEPSPAGNPEIDKVARGQKLIVYAALVYFAAFPAQIAFGPLIGFLIALAAVPVALVGLGRMTRGMGLSIAWRIVLFVLMFVPLVNLLTLLIVNSRATAALRAAGYRVGFLGASK